MKNLTLIIAFIIGTSFALSAQRGGGTLNTNDNRGGSNTNIRGNSTLNTNPNLGNTSRGGSNTPTSRYGRGGDRPNGYGNTNNGRPSNNGRGGGHHGHNNGRPNNNGHHGHHNNGHHGNVNVVVTTGHHGHNYNGYCNYSNHNYGWSPVCVSSFNVGCRSIRSCGYDRDRLRAARHFVRNNYVSSHQIADIMLMFSFESTRLEFAKYAFHRTCDIQNYGIVFDYLSFNSSRRELDCYIRDFHW